VKTFYETADIDNRLFAACAKMDEMIAEHYDPTKDGTAVGNLIAGFVKSARSAMLMSFWDVAGYDARNLSSQYIEDIVRLAPKK
jgi:hypothetical protein